MLGMLNLYLCCMVAIGFDIFCGKNKFDISCQVVVDGHGGHIEM